MDTNLFVGSLLVGRVISTLFLLHIIWKQVVLLHENEYPELKLQPLRWRLFSLSVIAITLNAIAISLDASALLGYTAPWFIILYAYANNLSFLGIVVAFWAGYRVAERD